MLSGPAASHSQLILPGGTGAAGAGEAERVPRGSQRWKLTPGGRRGCPSGAVGTTQAAAGRETAAGNSAAALELSAAATVSATGPSDARTALAAQKVLFCPRTSTGNVVFPTWLGSWLVAQRVAEIGLHQHQEEDGDSLGVPGWGHPATAQGCPQALVSCWEGRGLSPERGAKGEGSKTIPSFSDPLRCAPAWSNQDPKNLPDKAGSHSYSPL